MSAISATILRKYLPYLEPVSHQVLFNACKHHLRFLQAKLLIAREQGEEVIAQNIHKIGHNVIDLYTGLLTPQQISAKIISALQLSGVTDCHTYRTWLIQQNNGFINLEVEDQSLWTLLSGRGKQYIHIHPARYSPHSLRVKALTLKSAIWISYEMLRKPEIDLNLEFINSIRKRKLKASPIKSMSFTENLRKIVYLIIST